MPSPNGAARRWGMGEWGRGVVSHLDLWDRAELRAAPLGLPGPLANMAVTADDCGD